MSLTDLPDNLPVAEDDGAAAHLLGMRLPKVALTATNGETVHLEGIVDTVVIYIYPMTGRPDMPLPDGWDDIPGARGCTPQSCAFRDHYADLQSLGASVFGLSAQSSDYQQEAKSRLHLPFEILSDSALELQRALSLPTFVADGMTLYRRITLIAVEGVIKKFFYPIFPPGENAEQVLDWLRVEASRIS